EPTARLLPRRLEGGAGGGVIAGLEGGHAAGVGLTPGRRGVAGGGEDRDQGQQHEESTRAHVQGRSTAGDSWTRLRLFCRDSRPALPAEPGPTETDGTEMAHAIVPEATLRDLGWAQITRALADRTATARGAERALALPFLERRDE